MSRRAAKVTAPLHLLRPFTGWSSGTSVKAAEQWIAELAAESPGGYFYTETARPPKRHKELSNGGSVYFVKKGLTVFRMPIRGFEESPGGTTAILMGRELIRVEPKRVGFLRGWRYLSAADAPQDRALGEDIPEDIEARLDALGVRELPATGG